MAADVELGYANHPSEWDRERLMDEVVVEVISVCQHGGRCPIPQSYVNLSSGNGSDMPMPGSVPTSRC